MTDFYAVLRTAITESKADNAMLRAAVYARARGSLEKQLDSLQPSLTVAARSEQRLALEEAVRRIEAEAGSKPAANVALAAAAPPKQPQIDKVPPSGFAPAATRAPAAAPTPAAPPAAPVGRRAPAATPAVPRPAAQAERTAKAPSAKGRTAGLVAALVAVAVIAVGAFAYWQWGVSETQLADQSGGNALQNWLDADDGSVEPSMDELALSTTPDAPPMEERPRGTALAPTDGGSEMGADRVSPAEEPAEADVEWPALRQPQVAIGIEKDQSSVPSANLPTERASLLVEQDPPGSEDKEFMGKALWSLSGSGASTSLAVAVSFPERSADISLVFRLNLDKSLPASHTIEVIYRGPNDPDGTITNLPGFTVRSNNGERRPPLRGAGALVVPGQFLFGLSAEPADRKHNMAELKAGNWLLAPVQFESGRRAVITIEKGKTGEEAMTKAFAAWETAQRTAQSQ